MKANFLSLRVIRGAAECVKFRPFFTAESARGILAISQVALFFRGVLAKCYRITCGWHVTC
jgi:hypothetical protein